MGGKHTFAVSHRIGAAAQDGAAFAARKKKTKKTESHRRWRRRRRGKDGQSRNHEHVSGPNRCKNCEACDWDRKLWRASWRAMNGVKRGCGGNRKGRPRKGRDAPAAKARLEERQVERKLWKD